MKPEGPQTFIQDLERRVTPLERKLCELYWALATTGEEKIAHDLAKTEKELKLIFSNREELKQLQKWQQEGLKDPKLSRQIDLLIKAYIPNQLDEKTIADLVERQTEIENIFTNFRSELDGKSLSNNDLKEILKSETNSERREKAWEATKQIGLEVSEKVRELAKLRNKAARQLGFHNHFEMSLSLQELDSSWVLNTFKNLKQKTDVVFKERIQKLHQKLAATYQIPDDAVMIWHYDDPFAQSAPAQGTIDLDPYLKTQDILKICREFYESIDLNITDVLERSDLFERPKKNQHAFCITMDKAKDVRVLANIRPNAYWASTMLHELGHAAYSKNIDPKLPYFLRDEAHTFTTEAIAMLMERMLKHPKWLDVRVGIPRKELDDMQIKLWDSLSLDKLIIARWVMLVTNFEKEFYANPDQNLNALWWHLVKEYQFLEQPNGRQNPDWAAKIHISSYPAYYHNYLLGELFAAQIAEALEKEALKKPLREASFDDVPEIGKLLKNRLFKMGREWHWQKLVPHVTGQKLTEDSFVKQFC